MRFKRITFLVITMVIVFQSMALAASDEQNPKIPIGAVINFIIWGICLSRKQKPIGGWLLYFYIQLYLGFALTILVLFASMENYSPFAWKSVFQYCLFLLSTVPEIAIRIAEVIVATSLLKVRTWKRINYLKLFFLADLLFKAIGIGIDAKYFRDFLFIDILGVIWVMVWLLYFLKSERVLKIFKNNDWPCVENNVSNLSNEDMMALRERFSGLSDEELKEIANGDFPYAKETAKTVAIEELEKRKQSATTLTDHQNFPENH